MSSPRSSVAALLATLAILLAYDRRIAAIFVASAAATFVALRLIAILIMAVARELPRARATVLAARGRQYPSARRADADHRALARPRRRGAGDRDPDRRQSAPAIRGRLARQGAGLLLRRYPVRRCRSASTPSSRRARRTPSSNACRCCAAASSRPTASRRRICKPPPSAAWVLQSDRGITHTADIPLGLARGRRQMVGRRL